MNSKKELIGIIQDIENGIAAKPDGEILERLTSRLARAKQQLLELEQAQPEKPSFPKPQHQVDVDFGQLPKAPPKTAPKAPPKREVKTPVAVPSISEFIRKQAAAVFAAPVEVPYVTIQMTSGKSEDMDEAQLKQCARRYFSQIVDSATMHQAFESGSYSRVIGLAQYRNLVAFLAGLDALGAEKMTAKDLLFRYSRRGGPAQERAEKLGELLGL